MTMTTTSALWASSASPTLRSLSKNAAERLVAAAFGRHVADVVCRLLLPAAAVGGGGDDLAGLWTTKAVCCGADAGHVDVAVAGEVVVAGVGDSLDLRTTEAVDAVPHDVDVAVTLQAVVACGRDLAGLQTTEAANWGSVAGDVAVEAAAYTSDAAAVR